MPDWRSQLRALVGVFFARFFDNEITGGGQDLKTAFFALLAFLAAPGALLPFWLGQGSMHVPPSAMINDTLPPSAWGWAMIAKFKGIDALRALSLTDKTFYLACAVAASALLTALVWNSLLPDRRDVLVLSPLPARPSTVVTARLLALAGYLGIATLAMHTVASFSFGTQLAANNTVAFAFRGMAAHFIASCGASAFVLLAVVSAQGVLLAVGGPRVFARTAPTLQIILIAVAIAALLSISTISGAVADTLRHGPQPHRWILWTPPLWFLGLYETLLGTTDPTLTHLARIAVIALATVLTLTLVTYPIVYARLVRTAVEQGAVVVSRRWAFVPRLMSACVSRRPQVRAVSEFFLMTLARVDRHRFVLAAAVGIAVAWGMAEWIAFRSASALLPRVDALAIPLSTLLVLVLGMRLAAALPADAAPPWMFEVLAPTPRDVRQGVERTIALLVALPIVALSTVFMWRQWGSRFALTHAAFLSSVSVLVLEVALWRVARMPCTKVWRPDGASVRRSWPLYLAGFFALTTGLAGVESLLGVVVLPPKSPNFVAPPVWLVPAVIGFILAFAVLIRRAAASAPPEIADEENLGILTEAFRAGAEHEGPLDAAAEEAFVPRGRAARSRQTLFEPMPEEQDPWFDGATLRPGELWRDLQFALRRLRRSPAFALFSVMTLALGIGATTTAYSIVRAVNRPLDIRDPASVVAIGSMSWPDFQDLRGVQHLFADVQASSQFQASLAGRAETRVVMGELVTGSYFQLLGVDASRGRSLQAADDDSASAPVIVLAEASWRKQFGADPAIVGTAVRIGGQPYLVVGILPASFRGVQERGPQPAFWAPLAHPPPTDAGLTAYRDATRRDRPFLRVIARLRPDVSRDDARWQVQNISKAFDVSVPLPAQPGSGSDGRRRWTVAALGDDPYARGQTTVGFVIMLLPAIVLLIACTNLANLVLSRGASRGSDLAVRRALGASRWSLVREQVVEHGLVTLAGGLAGIELARVGVVDVASFVDQMMGQSAVYQFDPRVDVAAVVAACAAAAVATVVAGLIPAVQLTRGGIGRISAAAAGATVAPRWRSRGRLIAVQVAASVVLLLIAALCVRVLLAMDTRTDAQMDLSNVGAIEVAIDLRTHDAESVRRTADDLVRSARAAGVSLVGVMSGVPGPVPGGLVARVTTPDRAQGALTALTNEDLDTGRSVTAGTPDMFRVLGLRLLFGRAFEDSDTATSPRVVVVSEQEARERFGAVNVVGQSLQMQFAVGRGGTETRVATIVGVVSDAGRQIRQAQADGTSETRPRRDLYVPFSQRPAPDLTFPVPPLFALGRANGADGAAAVVATLRTALRATDEELAVTFAGRARLLSTVAAEALLQLIAPITIGLALVAVFLSTTGLYGVVSQVVAGSTREMGIRIALGAERRRILRLVLVDGARPVVQGLGIGLVVAAIVRQAMRPMFQIDVVAVDLPAVVVSMAPLLAAAAIACYLPARRAARVDPNVALRDL